MLPTEDSLWVGAELSRRFGPRYWTLTTSATDANRGAIRIARMITGRPKVLVFSGCYHGGVEEAHVEIRDGHVGMRNMIHPNGVDHDAVSRVVEFNDVAALEAALAQGDVACVLTEPLMTNFGMIPVDAGFHARCATHPAHRHRADHRRDAHHLLRARRLHPANRLEPDIFVAGKAIAGGIPAGVFGVSQEIAERLWKIVPYVNPRVRQSAHLGIGGTLAGNALTVATMRAVLEEVLTPANYDRMIANATRLADAIRGLIGANHLPWHVTQIGARAEIMFMPRQPRSGADVIAGRQPDLETLLHAFYMNEGILVTPFHTMFLMCPATSDLMSTGIPRSSSASSICCVERGDLIDGEPSFRPHGKGRPGDRRRPRHRRCHRHAPCRGRRDRRDRQPHAGCRRSTAGTGDRRIDRPLRAIRQARPREPARHGRYCRRAVGRLDILVHNAGGCPWSSSRNSTRPSSKKRWRSTSRPASGWRRPRFRIARQAFRPHSS